MSSLHAVIMAGGSGTRFWPASRQARPKQFLPLAHGKPLIEATVDRLRGLCDTGHVWIVTNERQAAALPQVLPSFPKEQVIVEPEARDTAPCVALATAVIAARDPEATIALLPADHVIAPTDAFQRMLRRGAAIAHDGRSIVTFGIAPAHAATGYGYIECGEPADAGEPVALRARRFREKPDAATAAQFVAAGNYLWNSGIFVWSLAAIRTAMRASNTELAAAFESMFAAADGGDRDALAAAFRRAPKKSIDYAVMEKAPHVVVVRAPVRWDDVGSFPALTAVTATDTDGNAALLGGGAATVLCESRDNIVYAEGKRTVALFSVRDLVVVAVGDAVMVCPRSRAEDLKVLIEKIKADGRADLL